MPWANSFVKKLDRNLLLFQYHKLKYQTPSLCRCLPHNWCKGEHESGEKTRPRGLKFTSVLYPQERTQHCSGEDVLGYLLCKTLLTSELSNSKVE